MRRAVQLQAKEKQADREKNNNTWHRVSFSLVLFLIYICIYQTYTTVDNYSFGGYFYRKIMTLSIGQRKISIINNHSFQ